MKVFLAGGMKSQWRDVLTTKIQRTITWLNPCTVVLNSNIGPDRIIPQICAMIEESDVVFAYLEQKNPGLNLIFELGYAAAMGKYIIFVDERSSSGEDLDYVWLNGLVLARHSVTEYYVTWVAGVRALENLCAKDIIPFKKTALLV